MTRLDWGLVIRAVPRHYWVQVRVGRVGPTAWAAPMYRGIVLRYALAVRGWGVVVLRMPDRRWDGWCCAMMREYSVRTCGQDHDCPDVLVTWDGRNGPGLPVRDGEHGAASSYVVIAHCPWCGRLIGGDW